MESQAKKMLMQGLELMVSSWGEGPGFYGNGDISYAWEESSGGAHLPRLRAD